MVSSIGASTVHGATTPWVTRQTPKMASAPCAAIGAVAAMVAALYFAGQGLTAIALVGTSLFVLLGGASFELARRRSR